MALLTIPQKFYPGDAISGVNLDSDFSAVSKVTAAITEANFRRITGIGNDRKTAPYNYHVISFGVPQVRLTASQTKTFFVWGYPYYKQGLYSDQPGTLGPDNILGGDYPIELKNIQGCYHSATALQAGDTMALTVSACRKNFLNASSGPSALNIKNDGTIQTADITGWDDVVYAVAVVQIVADATVATRIINNITGAICVKMAHVR